MMKKLFVLSVLVVMIAGGCQRSQFSSATRQSKNGKVYYVNQYHREKRETARTKSRNYPGKAPGAVNQPVAGISKITPVSTPENLVASNSREPVVIAGAGASAVRDNAFAILLQSFYGMKPGKVFPDTSKSKTHKKRTSRVPDSCHQIRFTNGHVTTATIVGRSGDTLRYYEVSEPGVVRTVMMDKVDTILPLKPDSVAASLVDNRKAEPLGVIGFVFSFVGLIPLIGLPFAIMAIIFGAISLKKTRRHPDKYKKGFGLAAVIIGAIGILALAVFFIAMGGGGGPGQISMGS